MPAKLLIFDCDGTIVDSQSGIVIAMVYAFETIGLTPPPRAKTLSVVGLSLPEAFHVLAPECDAATRAVLAERYKNAFRDLDREVSEHELLFPDAKSIIEMLGGDANFHLGIATGKSRKGVDRLFHRENWHDLFATIQTADDHPSKPDPSMVHAAMLETGTGPAATLVIGDTTYDIEMARAAGAGAIGVSWGYHHANLLREAGADLIIDTYGELPGAIETLFLQRERAA